MGALRGAFTAVLGLVALETVLSSDQAAQRSSGILTGAAAIINHALNPSIALIPNLSGDPSLDPQSAASSSSSGGSGSNYWSTPHQLPDGSTYHPGQGDPNNAPTYDPPFTTKPSAPAPPATPPDPSKYVPGQVV